jgi:predicted ATPase
VFAGPFTLDAARVVATGHDIDEGQVVESIASLVDKSLLVSADNAGSIRYRLLDMTHTYMTEKRIDTVLAASLSRRHAQFFCDYLDRIVPDNKSVDILRDSLADIRAALKWCFSSEGDRAIGIELTSASAHYFVELSLLPECLEKVQQAIAAIATTSTSPRRELALRYAAGVSSMFIQNSYDALNFFEEATKLAKTLGDLYSELRLLSAIHIFKTRVADFAGALEMSERCISVAKKLGDPSSVTMAEWMAGTANHLLGNQKSACLQCGSALTRTISPEWGSVGRLGYDRRIIALNAHARALWLSGRSEQAAEAANYAIQEAHRLDNPWTLVFTLVYSTSVFVWRGDWERAEENIEGLIAHCEKYSLKPYHAAGLGLQGDLTLRVSSPAAGICLLRDSLESASQIQLLAPIFMGSLAEGLVMIGNGEEALVSIEAAVAQPVSFAYPELLRIRSEVQRCLNQPASAIESSLLQSIECARNQTALGWELRAAIALARLWSDGGRSAEALALLKTVYEKFTEGFETADLRRAHLLLGELQNPTNRLFAAN